jgi:sporulation protein YlmC with PRC-barrel domain
MRRISTLFSSITLAALLLIACGGGATSTNVVESPPPVTIDATDEMTEVPTEAPTEAPMTTETPGVPVTGDVNPARLSNQLDFSVWSQDGEEIGDVEDMVLDMDNSSVMYVIVGAGGFLGIGERDVLVPWEMLELQSGTGEATGGQQNAFILQSDVDTFSNAPDVDLSSVLPGIGEPATDWDIDIRNYWEGGGSSETEATPAAEDTVDPNATAVMPPDGEATTTEEPVEATATAGTGEDTSVGEPQALQGVMLASDVLGATVTLGTTGEQATAVPEATADPGMTATPDTGDDTGLGVGTDEVNATVEDVIVDPEAGDLLYFVVSAVFDDGDRWIPIPLRAFQWNPVEEDFVLNADATLLQDAPFVEVDQFPDTTVSGWNSEFDAFWQNTAP